MKRAEKVTRRQVLGWGATGLAMTSWPVNAAQAGQPVSQPATSTSQPASRSAAASTQPTGAHRQWLADAARAIHANDRPPKTVEEWQANREGLRRNLRRSFGLFPETACGLDPQILGVVERDGFRIERLLIQSRPGVWITANAYVPAKRGGRVPAVLAVHGHWPWARIDPHVQARCLGLVKLGYFVLAMDAFGAGERAVEIAAGTYHGSMLAAGLWPAGVPLLGLQVYDNMRAADYLQTREEVDPTKLGITGASGGGNQTMYAGAFDERFRVVVPVCSVGTFQAYLTGANCVCETLIGGLRYCEEGDVLALVAPRALMVINATNDSLCFGLGEAAKSIASARKVFKLLQAENKIRHVAIESGHDYNQPMREAMYGWMDRWLRDRGSGGPATEPPIQTEELDVLRCFPDKKRPATFCLLPQYVHREAEARSAAIARPTTAAQWHQAADRMRAALRDEILGRFPPRCPLSASRTPAPPLVERPREFVEFDSEPGMRISGWWMPAPKPDSKAPLVLCLHPEGAAQTMEQALTKRLAARPCHLLAVELRGTGRSGSPIDPLGDCPDHNSARWSIWLGRPLLGQWAWDIFRTMDLAAEILAGRMPREICLLGFREAGLAAILAAGVNLRIARAAAVQTLASYVTDRSFKGQRMAVMIPNILTVGDIPYLAALAAARPLAIAAPVNAQTEPLPADRIEEAFQPTRQIYDLLGKGKQFTCTPDADSEGLAAWLAT